MYVINKPIFLFYFFVRWWYVILLYALKICCVVYSSDYIMIVKGSTSTLLHQEMLSIVQHTTKKKKKFLMLLMILWCIYNSIWSSSLEFLVTLIFSLIHSTADGLVVLVFWFCLCVVVEWRKLNESCILFSVMCPRALITAYVECPFLL